MTGDRSFAEVFSALTGNKPLAWQTRLYKHFAEGSPPPAIDIPTGLGKTMVMALWLIARALHPDKMPTRLIYVVDRRTVVDQATDLAQRLRDNCQEALGIESPAISTLRGQLADNREWSRDPSKPAIIIGTVDLIGSALLFSGYRSSYKRRPLEAGLLGQDSLLVLDEAHLSQPFEKLLASIGEFQKSHGSPTRVVRMSATRGDSIQSKPFPLQLDTNGNLTGEDARDATIVKRFGAKKTLRFVGPVDVKKLIETIADSAIGLATNPKLIGKRIVVFVRRPADARDIAEKIRKHVVEAVDKSGPKPKKAKTEVLTGTMRGLERDKLVKKPVLQRFLDGDEKPGDKDDQPVFLVCTSAGEVGFDLNADHMVCDATTIDSFIQRLGRVNRRGYGEARVIVIRPGQLPDKTDLDKAVIKTIELLSDGMSLSPQNIAALKTGEWKDKYAEACSPEPTTVELTDIFLDAWSMTSITEKMPGRPEVAPWLRGLDNEQAQTTVAWRAELDLLPHNSLAEKALAAIFAKHRIRPHESLTVNTGQLVENFLKKIPKLKDRPGDLLTIPVAVRLPRGQVVCRTVEALINDPAILYADSTLILPARFGGLDTAGMLDAEAIPKVGNDDDPVLESLDVADPPGYEATEKPVSRLRVVIKRDESGLWGIEPLNGGAPLPDNLAITEKHPKTTPLFNAFRTAGYRVRLRQDVRFDEEDVATESLVCLALKLVHASKEDQSLSEHVGKVKSHATRIANDIKLTGPVREALLFAAHWHDEGKKAAVWQRFANGPMDDGQPKGKMIQTRDPKSLRGYRHEFGSLLRVHWPNRCGPTIDCELPADPAIRDLALHLIATHHGSGRPHFPPAIYDPFTDDERDELHTESIRRFARLQRKYGWWYLAWLENLLRCADALGSADTGSTTDEDEVEVVE